MAEEQNIVEVQSDEQVQIEEVDSSGSFGDLPELAPVSDAEAAPAAPVHKQSRSEKRARKALVKLGLKQVDGFLQATLKNTDGMTFSISNPDVYTSSADPNTYIIFGEANLEDHASQRLSEAASDFQIPEEDVETTAPSGVSEVVAEDDEEMELGVPKKYIDLVLEQVEVSREEAAEALKATGNDLVQSIMDLEMNAM
eukprot:TRINITY_DN10806_c0_g1_i1.p1 TRINITY_DN10806_c0_g1~~TRINITY_DN10806_c0_g1_i1.p1  ORF type:complete len:229 (-),score=76.26 TRINITY_DN10806_c0_g1_i1:92-685(-)